MLSAISLKSKKSLLFFFLGEFIDFLKYLQVGILLVSYLMINLIRFNIQKPKASEEVMSIFFGGGGDGGPFVCVCVCVCACVLPPWPFVQTFKLHEERSFKMEQFLNRETKGCLYTFYIHFFKHLYNFHPNCHRSLFFRLISCKYVKTVNNII